MSPIKDKLKNIAKNKLVRAIFFIVLILAIGALLILVYSNINIIILNQSSFSSTNSNSDIKIRINEYMTSNDYTLRDDVWNSPDWIEIYNYGAEPVWLGDIYLTDNIENPTKFQLPDVSMQPNEYIIVLASDSTVPDDNYINAPFKLGKKDKHLALFLSSEVVDMLDFVHLPADISAGYDSNNQFGFFNEPTPGYENLTTQYDNFDIVPVNKYKDILIINEYLSSNQYNITDSDGDHNDWIELYNPNKETVFLGDFFVSDDENEPNKLRLPNIELDGNEYIIVYASGKTSDNEKEIHASFNLGNGDKKIILSHKSGHIVNSCNVHVLPVDVSEGLNENGEMRFFEIPTPNEKNDTNFSTTIDITASYIATSPIIINEWMPNNQFGILDTDGDASDWLELFNPTNENISLDGYALTDNIKNPFKWLFPSSTEIPANSYLMIFASGKNKSTDGKLHTNFALSSEEHLYLIAPNSSIADSVELEDMAGNVSKGVTPDGYGYFSLPTPGEENNTAYHNEIDDNISFLLSDVYISEVSSSSVTSKRYLSKPLYEYIELYNSGNQSLNLNGYSLSESNGSTFFLGDVTIEPNQYFLVALKGTTEERRNIVQTNALSLNSAGERILFKNSDGIIIDCFDTGYLLGDYSSGRIIGDEYNRVFFTEKTPNKVNSTENYSTYSEKPQFSHLGGEINEPFVLSITASHDATIYYTLKGNPPTENSLLYTQPLTIDRDAIVRAIAVTDGKLPSLSVSNTYMLERTHDIPVICIATSPYDMFGELTGIYANGAGYGVGEYPYKASNYFWDIERPISFEYYDESGQLDLAFDGGIQIAGGYTRIVPQKSLVIRLRDEYGTSSVDYQLFEEGASTFSHIYLRNSGQDGWKTKLRDYYFQSCALALGTVDAKRGRPVAVYINGYYWGLYNLRDKINADHFATKYSIDVDSVDIIGENSSTKSGNNVDWLELMDFCEEHNFSKQEDYELLAQKVDVDAFMDYIIIESFFGNVDTHNINFWKSDEHDGKWRPVLFDMDLSVRGIDYSILNLYLGNSYLGCNSVIIKSLSKNESFNQQLLARYAFILNNVFTEDFLLNKLNDMTREIDSEMTHHLERWNRPRSRDYWQKCVDVLKEGVITRRAEAVSELQDYYDISDTEIAQLFPWSSND